MVVIAELENEELQFRAINSCIRLAHSINSLGFWSVEDLVAEDGSLHPVQNAMLHAHASQCGFCTPGFVMSLFAMYQKYTAKGVAITRELAQKELAGNLCRCTGYRPILDAAMQLENFECPPSLRIDQALLKQQLLSLSRLVRAEEQLTSRATTLGSQKSRIKHSSPPSSKGSPPYGYEQPKDLSELLSLKALDPHAQLIAGSTDVGLWITKHFKTYDHIIDLTQVQEIRRVEEYPHHIAIGAGVRVEQGFESMLKDRPQLKIFAQRFAGLPIRNSATIGGNIANGSPIGDTMPMLIALGASLVLMRMHRGAIRHREILLERFYTGYRTNILEPTEVIAWIKVPRPQSNEIFRTYKISKRFDDDISAVCLCVNLSVSNGLISFASIGVGGVAATPAKAYQTEDSLRGEPFRMGTFNKACKIIADEFQPLSDMRGSAAYRKHILGSLLKRFAIETLELNNLEIQPTDTKTQGEFWIDLSDPKTSELKLSSFS
jgi:xanthine dehydrogenase small subunit